MALIQKPTSSFASIDETKPRKIKVQTIRMWKGNKKEPGNLIEMVVLDSSGTRIHATLDDEYVKKLLEPSDREGGERKDFSKWIKDKSPRISKPHFENELNVKIFPNVKIFLNELLNSIKVPGFPNHILKLKVGAPIMLLKDLGVGLCIGTRLSITRMCTSLMVEARVLTGDKAGEKVLIPRIPMETNFPIKMRRRQFPFTLAFAMIINKSQGIQLSKVGIFQPRRVLPHGPMYVAMSKVKSKDGARIIITNKDGKPEESTRNVVFKEVSQDM